MSFPLALVQEASPRTVQKPDRHLNEAVGVPMILGSDTLAVVPTPSHPLQFVLVALAGWFNQQQRDVIDYLLEENQVLRETDRSQAPALHRRPAPSAGGESSDVGATAVAPVRHDRDARHVAGVAPSAHCQAIRRQCSAWSRTAAGHARDPNVDRANGHRKPWLG